MGTLDYLLQDADDSTTNGQKQQNTIIKNIKQKIHKPIIPSGNYEKRRCSMVELLHDLYDTTGSDRFFAGSSQSMSIETDSMTDDHDGGSVFSDVIGASDQQHQQQKMTQNFCSPRLSMGDGSKMDVVPSEGHVAYYNRRNLHKFDIHALRKITIQLKISIAKQSQLLVCYLKRRDHQVNRLHAKCDLVTAILQAMSPKRSVDAKLQFTPEPPACESGYSQWLNGMKAVARLPDGMPEHFRQKLWLTLADHYVKSQQLNWEDVKRWAFNDRMNPDDDELSLQIVKDLHRTGWSGLDGDKERIILRRVLLAYARYNKSIGYCQGFNVIVALILEITGYNEEQAFKVTIMLLEHVLPASYFDQTLRALSVDMAVLRDMMQHRLPRLSAHLDILQQNSESEFEPPLVNVFSMQWFLTLFATCLPKRAVHRIWDSLMLEGSEILLRAALALWSRIGKRLIRCRSADSFYTQMGIICQELTEMTDDQCNDVMNVIYNMADFPYPGLDELRDRHMFNIQPFSSTIRLLRHQAVNILKPSSADSSDEGGADYASPRRFSKPSFGGASPRRGSCPQKTSHPADLSALEKQYKLLRQRQKQAAIVVRGVFSNGLRIQNVDNMKNGTINGNLVKNYAQMDVFNHLHVKQPKKGATITTCTFNGTVPHALASKAVQPSGKAKRPTRPQDPKFSNKTTVENQSKMSNGRRRESSSSTASSITTVPASYHFPTSGINFGRNQLLSRCDTADHVEKFLDHVTKYSSALVSPRHSEHNYNFTIDDKTRRRSLDDIVFWKPHIIRRKLVIRKSNSCMQLSFDDGKRDDKNGNTIGSKRNDKVNFRQPAVNLQNFEPKRSSAVQKNTVSPTKCHNPFPVKRQTSLKERGKKFGLYIN